MIVIKLCKQCNKPFNADSKEIKRGNAIYCGLSCSAKNQRKHAILYTLTCQGCNKIFTAKYRDAKYCSSKCKLVVYRRLQKAEQSSIKTFQRILSFLPCELCGWKESTRDLHHIISVFKKGKTTLDNLICLCPNHHRMVHRNLISQDTLINVLKLRLSLHPDLIQE